MVDDKTWSTTTHKSIPLDTLPEVYVQVGGIVDRFVDAWESADDEPVLREFVPEAGVVRQLALVELIKVDLEIRWTGVGTPRHIEEYLEEFPELSQEGKLPSDLIYEEFCARRGAGLQVDAAEYLDRFPANAGQLQHLMQTDATSSARGGPSKKNMEVLDGIEPGEVIEDFQLLNRLGKGAFAVVFLARQVSMQRLVALKVSTQESAEPQTLGQFDHDFIVRVYDQRFSPDRGLYLLYMQYVPGGSLSDVLKYTQDTPVDQRTGADFLAAIDDSLERRGESRTANYSLRKELSGLTWPQTVAWITSRIALALHYADQRGVLHRDVKPANVLLSHEGVPKLADFNVSFCSKLDGASAGAHLGGSLAYMSPEQLQACNPTTTRGADSLDGRSDIYSLAVLAWELLTGKRPFDEPEFRGDWGQTLGQLETLRAGGVAEHQVDSTLAGHRGIRRVLSQALSPTPDDRPESGQRFAQQLELATDENCERYLQPNGHSWRLHSKRWLFLLILFATVLPSILAAIANFAYNQQQIIAKMSDYAQRYFMSVQSVTNAVAFPAGLALMAWLTRAVLSTRGERRCEPTVALIESTLNYGRYAAWICIALWTLAGLTYPLSMKLGGFSMPLVTSGHFFFSLVLCGLFAVSLNYFGVTALTLRAVVPWFFSGEPEITQELPSRLDDLSRSSWLYLSMSAAVPMLTTTALVSGNQDNVRIYLILISLGGFLAFLMALALFRSISRDIDTLNRISEIVNTDKTEM